MSQSDKVWNSAILPAHATIGQAIRNLDQVAIRIVLIANEEGVLEGTISDGDIRRGLLKGLNMDSTLNSVINRNALVVVPHVGPELVLQLMLANKIQQIPVVDEQHRLVGLHLWDEISTPRSRPNVMVIMAGGMGTRLRPLTIKCPKPLLPVAGKPMLEHIIERAKLEGISHFILSINYLGHMIEAHFGNGDRIGVRIDYLREDVPLGTAGALGLLNPRPDGHFIVTNGDVITDIRYGEMLDFHLRQSADATMAVRLFEWQHPFGVVQTQGVKIIGFEEKPISRSHINAGVYVLNPSTLDILAAKTHCDMPNLFMSLQNIGRRIVAYPMHEPWLDVGRKEDLDIAQKM